MTTTMLWIVTVLYLIQTIVCFVSGNKPQGVILLGYVVANLGLIWSFG